MEIRSTKQRCDILSQISVWQRYRSSRILGHETSLWTRPLFSKRSVKHELCVCLGKSLPWACLGPQVIFFSPPKIALPRYKALHTLWLGTELKVVILLLFRTHAKTALTQHCTYVQKVPRRPFKTLGVLSCLWQASLLFSPFFLFVLSSSFLWAILWVFGPLPAGAGC